jgi:uncharacterized protein
MESLSIFLEYLVSGADHCRTVVENHGSLLASLFVAGLIGGAGHCIAMCGPFVIAQSVSRLETVAVGEMREFHRIAGAALAPYHLGRTTTYIVLGAFAAEIAGGVMDSTGARWLSAFFLAVAAVLFLGYGIRKLAGGLPFTDAGAESWWSRRVGNYIKPLFARPVGLRGYGLGVALGFLPCGLLYGALAAAAASGSFLAGAFVMAAFAAGTVPALLVVGFAGHVAGRRWRNLVGKITPALMVLNALILSVMAWQAIA